MKKGFGSEKIQNPDEKLARIKEIAGIEKGELNEVKYGRPSDVLHEAVSADGRHFGIVQEEKYVYIKEMRNGTYEYMTGVENIREHSYKTYADALKHLNLIFKEINESTDHAENIDVLKKKV